MTVFVRNLGLALLLGHALVVPAAAQQSQIVLSTFSTGYAEMSGATASSQATAGQMFIGGAGSDSFSVGGGFIAGFNSANAVVSLSLVSGWNLVSVPVTVSDYQKSVVFATAVSDAFKYNNSYVASSTLANGIGYWLKFEGDQSATIAGARRERDTIVVMTGWNMIGSISDTIGMAGIVSIPPGITTSSFFGYNGSYIAATQIEPGKGYWVKVNQDGKLILSASGLAEPSARIRIIPTAENPPSPPDAEIKDRVIPAEFALKQNYPNPFNPTTTIEFDIANPVITSLRIYDILGVEVATLTNERLEPGTYRRVWNAANTGSGVYFYKLTAGSFTSVRKFLLIK
ncbi:MAG TPA: T9SS type A sorting domain-containing protein [Bacteroidota bacterium]|nr:T9SS type A sorting domain-containing protein [Bacteroidota bacterium]